MYVCIVYGKRFILWGLYACIRFIPCFALNANKYLKRTCFQIYYVCLCIKNVQNTEL